MAEPASGGVPAALQPLLTSFREGKRGALARAISLVENEGAGFEELVHALLGEGGPARAAPPHAAPPHPSGVGPGPDARRVGVTGPPGAGKSTLLAALATAYRGNDERVGVVAVDPTSPFSGGALLGDRIRMNDLATDPGIFIRSMATRGSLGGLATTTREVMDLMDAFGFERLLVETVGVGQTELEITGVADTVVVVLVPESGDAIQAMKAGLMEIADVFVVNKADRPGADRLIKEIRTALHLRAPDELGAAWRDGVPAHHGVDLGAAGAARARTGAAPAGWEIPVLRAVAQTGEGVAELTDAISAHRGWLEASGGLAVRRRARAEQRVRDVVERALRRRAWQDAGVRERLARGLDGIARREETPYSVARAIVARLLGEGRDA